MYLLGSTLGAFPGYFPAAQQPWSAMPASPVLPSAATAIPSAKLRTLVVKQRPSKAKVAAFKIIRNGTVVGSKATIEAAVQLAKEASKGGEAAVAIGARTLAIYKGGTRSYDALAGGCGTFGCW